MPGPDLDNPVRPLVCVDLNGILDSYAGWKHPEHWDPPRPGARDFLAALASHGFDVVIFTTRHPAGVRSWRKTRPDVTQAQGADAGAWMFREEAAGARHVCFRIEGVVRKPFGDGAQRFARQVCIADRQHPGTGGDTVSPCAFASRTR